jgi:hypothetical protein
VAAHDELQAILLQELLRDIWPKLQPYAALAGLPPLHLMAAHAELRPGFFEKLPDV